MRQEFAVRLQNNSVTLTIQREGTEEVLLFMCPSIDEAEELAGRIVNRLREMGVDMQHVEGKNLQ